MDWVGAFVNLEGLLAALYMRERTGRGMMLQTSQYQSVATAGTTRLAEYLATGEAPRPMGSARPNIVPDQAFATADGFISVSVPHDGFWPKLCAAIERSDLAADQRFATNQSRVEQRATLVPMLASIFATRSSAEWVERLRAADVPVGELQRGRTLSESLLAHPQAQAEGVISVLETPWGAMATAEPHWRFDKTEARITRPSPAKGEHQQEILRELGIEQETAAG
jgi:crotonobetainyl-CoA:carnitine CoA-transferase CaiB-like acyl-CoA transferase